MSCCLNARRDRSPPSTRVTRHVQSALQRGFRSTGGDWNFEGPLAEGCQAGLYFGPYSKGEGRGSNAGTFRFPAKRLRCIWNDVCF